HGTGFMPFPHKVKGNRVSIFVKIDIFNIYIPSLTKKIPDQGGCVHLVNGNLHLSPVHGGPGIPKVYGLKIIYVGSQIDIAVGMPVEEKHHLFTVLPADLVVSAVLVPFSSNSHQLLIFSPGAAIGAGFKIKLPYPGIFGKKVKKTLARNIFWLGIGHLFFRDLLKGLNVIGFGASVFKSRTAPPPTTDKYPDVPLTIHGNAGVVMGIIH